MTRRRLRSIAIEGHTSIESAKVPLSDLNILIGANGAGKSNFISALALLGRLVDQELNLFVGQVGGASALLHGGLKGNARVKLTLDLAPYTYGATLMPAAGDELIFEDEWIGLPSGERFSLGQGHRESRLPNALTGQEESAAQHIVNVLRGCRVFHFHDTGAAAPVKQRGYTSDNITLHPHAGNLAAVLLRLREDDISTYKRIVRTVRQVAPFFRDFVLIEEKERLRLRWRQEGGDVVFPANALSDGTLRFICLATLLSLPDLPDVVVLDEPELGLHPYAIVQLADMIRAASRESQVLIATQSVTLINQFELNDLIVVERAHGVSTFDRPDPDRLQAWLADYSLGELWEKNLLGGRPQAEQG
ncbi:Predicted ATPase [Sinosporangium album]|uniref:Predicted ATPase n=1 Tax=Sinosporangium album TaxID=504805 RepID=A0A1G7SZX7_9ACTN|nr:AAA family ATPase [Sinosporangium album]SDG28623.1 Predicted ATPase [Sinosporangium album]